MKRNSIIILIISIIGLIGNSIFQGVIINWFDKWPLVIILYVVFGASALISLCCFASSCIE